MKRREVLSCEKCDTELTHMAKVQGENVHIEGVEIYLCKKCDILYIEPDNKDTGILNSIKGSIKGFIQDWKDA